MHCGEAGVRDYWFQAEFLLLGTGSFALAVCPDETDLSAVCVASMILWFPYVIC
jgi:hypothetical protein